MCNIKAGMANAFFMKIELKLRLISSAYDIVDCRLNFAVKINTAF